MGATRGLPKWLANRTAVRRRSDRVGLGWLVDRGRAPLPGWSWREKIVGMLIRFELMLALVGVDPRDRHKLLPGERYTVRQRSHDHDGRGSLSPNRSDPAVEAMVIAAPGIRNTHPLQGEHDRRDRGHLLEPPSL